MSRHYSISNEIFARFPSFLRGVVIATGITNPPSSPELVAALRAAESELSQSLRPEDIVTHPQIASWREAYRSTGIKPSEFRPSVEALARRVVKKDPLPTISTIVDLGNLVSIKNMVPIGAHAIDFVTRDIEVRLATGEEIFEPFGSDAVEHPPAGEIVFVEGDIVLTRRWTWRQSKHTLVVPETRSIEVNVDGLPPLGEEEIGRICEEVAELVYRYCGGETRFQILSRENPSMLLD